MVVVSVTRLPPACFGNAPKMLRMFEPASGLEDRPPSLYHARIDFQCVEGQ